MSDPGEARARLEDAIAHFLSVQRSPDQLGTASEEAREDASLAVSIALDPNYVDDLLVLLVASGALERGTEVRARMERAAGHTLSRLHGAPMWAYGESAVAAALDSLVPHEDREGLLPRDWESEPPWPNGEPVLDHPNPVPRAVSSNTVRGEA